MDSLERLVMEAKKEEERLERMFKAACSNTPKGETMKEAKVSKGSFVFNFGSDLEKPKTFEEFKKRNPGQFTKLKDIQREIERMKTARDYYKEFHYETNDGKKIRIHSDE